MCTAMSCLVCLLEIERSLCMLNKQALHQLSYILSPHPHPWKVEMFRTILWSIFKIHLSALTLLKSAKNLSRAGECHFVLFCCCLYRACQACISLGSLAPSKVPQSHRTYAIVQRGRETIKAVTIGGLANPVIKITSVPKEFLGQKQFLCVCFTIITAFPQLPEKICNFHSDQLHQMSGTSTNWT